MADTLEAVFNVSMAVVFLSVARGHELTPAWGWVFFVVFCLAAVVSTCKVFGHLKREWDND